MLGVGEALAAVTAIAQAATSSSRSGRGSPLILVAEGGVVAVVVGLGALRARRRRQIGDVASRLGLGFADDDPFGCDRGPLDFLHQGVRREVHAVVWQLTDDPWHKRVFELRWYSQRDREEDGRRRAQAGAGRSATCATAVVNGAFPYLRVGPIHLATGLRDAVLDDKIDLESEDFNRTFDVTCADRRFAVAFLDAQMQQLLLASLPGLSLEVNGAWLLVHGTSIPPKAVPGLLGLLDRIVATIPTVVNALNPAPLGPDPRTPMPDPYAANLVGSVDPVNGRGPIVDRDVTGWAHRAIPTGPDEPEYDLDGHPVEPQHEDPWGPGRPLHGPIEPR